MSIALGEVQIRVNRNTAAYYFQRLREIIVYQLEQASHEVFAGEIEVDESYFGVDFPQ